MTQSLLNIGLIRQSTGIATVQEIPMPDLRDDYILVRTVAVALNPTDWTTLDAPGDNGTLVGCDYAGIIEKVGKDVKRDFKVGDRICGVAHGANDANPQTGAFARYIVVKGDIQMHIPDDISFEEACTAGVGVATTGYALYKELGLSLPGEVNDEERGKPVLIYGGSTATGTVAIQFAKLSGYTVITTCSPKYFELTKERGADLVFDYRDPDVGKKIHAASKGQITKVFDTVSVESSAAICAKAMGRSGGLYCNLLGEHNCPRPDVKTSFFLGYSISGESYIFESVRYEAQPEAFGFATWFMELAGKLWAEGKWKAHRQRLMLDGLAGINEGLKEMRQGRVSGVKLVYMIDETNRS